MSYPTNEPSLKPIRKPINQMDLDHFIKMSKVQYIPKEGCRASKHNY
jgi:hypothetical protein